MDIYTINLDSMQTTSNTDFVVYLQKPLKNIIKVEILRASVSSSNVQDSVYIHIQELVTKLNDSAAGKGTLISTAQGSWVDTTRSTYHSEALVTWNPTTQPRTTFTAGTYWNATTVYNSNIDSVYQLSIKVVDKYGNVMDNIGTDITYLTLRFYCQTNSGTVINTGGIQDDLKTLLSQFLQNQQQFVESYKQPESKRMKIPWLIIAAVLIAAFYFLRPGSREQ